MVIISRTNDSVDLVGMIAQLGLLAIAFSSQLLPMTFDMLYIKKGTKEGALAGLAVGLAIVFLMSPMFGALSSAEGSLVNLFANLRTIVDLGAWGLAGNVLIFVSISVLKSPRVTASN